MSRIAVLTMCIGVGAFAVYAGDAKADEPSEGVLFNESFEDANLAQRGWYDGRQFRIAWGAAAGYPRDMRLR